MRGETPGTFASIFVDPLLLPDGDFEGTGIAKKALERVRVDVCNI